MGRSHFQQSTASRFVQSDLSLSSATIPDDLTMSNASIFDRTISNSNNNEVEGEKEILLRRLKELMISEESEVERNIQETKIKLSNLESEYLKTVAHLKEEFAKEEEELLKVQQEEVEALKKSQVTEEQRIVNEIRKLESELECILAPSKMLSALRDNNVQEDKKTVAMVSQNPELSDLEQELQCSNCMKVCAPPGMIFQCPEGDLLCESCRETVQSCPACNISLCPALLSRNKVLENISKKYFKC